MSDVSQNGWSVIGASSTKWWNLIDSSVRFQLRRGSAGFVLVHLVDWFDRNIESLQPTTGDDFGWALRRIAGSDLWSNHSSGTAVDLNASLHPQGKDHTFGPVEYDKIHRRLESMYEGKLRWGADYTTTVDEMHFEIQDDADAILKLSRKIEQTPRGQRLLSIN
jgi:hypothetical protein